MAPRNRSDKNASRLRLKSCRHVLDAGDVKKALTAFVGACGTAAAAATIAVSLGCTRGEPAVAQVVPAPGGIKPAQVTTRPANMPGGMPAPVITTRPAEDVMAMPVVLGGVVAPAKITTQPATQPSTEPATQPTVAPLTTLPMQTGGAPMVNRVLHSQPQPRSRPVWSKAANIQPPAK